MCYPQFRVTDPGTGSSKNISTFHHFCDIYQYIIDGKLPSSAKAQNCIRAEVLNYIVINHFLFRTDM